MESANKFYYCFLTKPITWIIFKNAAQKKHPEKGALNIILNKGYFARVLTFFVEPVLITVTGVIV